LAVDIWWAMPTIRTKAIATIFNFPQKSRINFI